MSPVGPLTADAAAFLDAAAVARLATADASGSPHVVPFCFARSGSTIYFVVDEKPKAAGKVLKRLRNIAENPRVALVADRYDDDWTRLAYVIVRGRAEVVADADEVVRALALLREKYPQYRAMRLEPGRNPVVRIAVESAHFWRASC